MGRIIPDTMGTISASFGNTWLYLSLFFLFRTSFSLVFSRLQLSQNVNFLPPPAPCHLFVSIPLYTLFLLPHAQLNHSKPLFFNANFGYCVCKQLTAQFARAKYCAFCLRALPLTVRAPVLCVCTSVCTAGEAGARIQL